MYISYHTGTYCFRKMNCFSSLGWTHTHTHKQIYIYIYVALILDLDNYVRSDYEKVIKAPYEGDNPSFHE